MPADSQAARRRRKESARLGAAHLIVYVSVEASSRDATTIPVERTKRYASPVSRERIAVITSCSVITERVAPATPTTPPLGPASGELTEST